MKGGFKLYRGSGAGARAYIEADHHRADDYYLSEGSGIAQLTEIAARTGEVLDSLALDGDAYQAWVEGWDVRTGEAKGRLRNDEHALRFAEVTVNGPKSWSIAAGLHPDVAVAYEAAQDRAVHEIGRWIAAHACTRIGRRGEQQQVPIDAIEMAAIRHYTSRAGDPHRHIHLQFNARVPVGEAWRGIDSAGLLRMQRAVNGIGHRAVITDPAFRQALAAHGYTLDVDGEGEIRELAEVVPAMSKRSAQVAANMERFEAQWRREHPGQEPTAAQRREWDRRAWATGRPDKPHRTTDPDELEEDWIAELRTLGVDVNAHRSAEPIPLTPPALADVDRTRMAERVVTVLGSGARGRSTWSRFDVRGAAEELLARAGVITDAAAVREAVEDITDRAIRQCVSVVDDQPIHAEHIRHLTSHAVIERERDLNRRLSVRGAVQGDDATVQAVAAAIAMVAGDDDTATVQLDDGQVAAVRAIAGSHALVMIQGAAGAGKTTTLAVANAAVEASGHRMRVVAPTKKAANVAGAEIGAAAANTAHALAHAHGWRWDQDGVWTRLEPGQVDPDTGVEYRGPGRAHQLAVGDVLLVDEAGMLDQDTARALLHIADAAGARLALVGDSRQLPAVGVGGVLDLAGRWSTNQQLAEVHRFRRWDVDAQGRQVAVRDAEYADLSLRIRSATVDQAPHIFDELAAGGHVQIHQDEAAALAAVATRIVDHRLAGRTHAVSVATNEAAAAINEVVREQLVERGLVDDTATTIGSDGLRLGAGDRVMTRKNAHELSVANREVWTVTHVEGDGSVHLTGASGTSELPADYVRENVHLAYAATGHGVQGETADTGDVVVSELTDAPALYVGLTRGRWSNTVHLVAGNLDQAREQWTETASRNRADLGLDHARQAARAEAANYSATPPPHPARTPAQTATRRSTNTARPRRSAAVPSAAQLAIQQATAELLNYRRPDHDADHEAIDHPRNEQRQNELHDVEHNRLETPRQQ